MRPPGHGSSQVPLGEDPDQTAVVGDRGRADLAVDHLLSGLADRVLGGDAQNVTRHQVGKRGHRKREHKERAPLAVQPCLLEVEIARDAAHHVVVDPALAPELEHGGSFGVEYLVHESLVSLRPFLDRTVVVGREPR